MEGGNISVTADLDYEVKTFYTFHVRCRDNTETSLTDTATVVVDILPINEFAPRVDRTSFTVFESESSVPGKVLVSVSPDDSGSETYQVTDTDEGGSETLQYSLTIDPEQVTTNSEHFSLDPVTGALSVTGSLDVDTTGGSDSVTVTMALCDMDPPSELCPNVRVRILISASNDNFPKLGQDMYEKTVPEDLSVNDTVDLGIVCTDDDTGFGSLQGIELSNQSLSMWEVDSEGNVTLREPLDYETSQSHEFMIKCLDTGGREDEATVVINVSPVNDNPPYFERMTYKFTVDRSEVPDYNVGTVTALDDDIGEDSSITYSVIKGNDNFELDANTGEITMVDYILASEGSSFTLEIMASDLGNFTASATVTIDVSGSLSVVGIAALTTSLLLVLIVCLAIFGLVCYLAIRVRPSKTFPISKDGTEMSVCAAYDGRRPNINPPIRDSAQYTEIPSLPVHLPPQTSATSLTPAYEKMPEDHLPWQFYYQPPNPYHHYDSIRERPRLELPTDERPDWQPGSVDGKQERDEGGEGMGGQSEREGRRSEDEQGGDGRWEGVKAPTQQQIAVPTCSRYINAVTTTAMEVSGPSVE